MDLERQHPWDVPVRIVSGVEGERIVRRVAVGESLPGIAALDVTLVRSGDALLLGRIRPVRRSDGASVGASEETLAALLAALAAVDRERVVPVLVEGTPFTLAVLAALCEVPAGQVVTYAGLAAAAGRPRAVRATATVMARNRVPLVLPCHRVVPASGGTGRYAFGEDVKSALLAVERSDAALVA